jgi:hypothetical protein
MDVGEKNIFKITGKNGDWDVIVAFDGEIVFFDVLTVLAVVVDSYVICTVATLDAGKVRTFDV